MQHFLGPGGSARRLVVGIPGIAEQKARGLLCCLMVIVSQHVGVDLQEESDVGVADALTDHLWAYASPKRAGGVRVPEIVKGDARQARRDR
jgi:hypothetical protein